VKRIYGFIASSNFGAIDTPLKQRVRA